MSWYELLHIQFDVSFNASFGFACLMKLLVIFLKLTIIFLNNLNPNHN